MTMQTDLQAAVDKAASASAKLHAIVHGDAASSVETENGQVKTVARTIADNEAAIAASREELDQKVTDAASNALAAAASALAAAGSAATASDRAAKIPEVAPSHALKGIRVNEAGDAYELYVGGGDVSGPADAADGELARFDGSTGKRLKGGGKVQAADIQAGVLGSVAARNVGTAPGNIPEVLADGRLPAAVLPAVDLSTRVARTGDTMTGPLTGTVFKSGGTTATTGFQVASGADLAAIFMAGLQPVNSNNSNGGIPTSDRGQYPQMSGTDLYGAASREQFASWSYSVGSGNKSSSGNSTPVVDRMSDGKLRLIWVSYTSYYNCDCNCMG
jgi:hypothetical protein